MINTSNDQLVRDLPIDCPEAFLKGSLLNAGEEFIGLIHSKPEMFGNLQRNLSW